jgi:hypothetical protein
MGERIYPVIDPNTDVIVYWSDKPMSYEEYFWLKQDALESMREE